jgi:hypothetical protein
VGWWEGTLSSLLPSQGLYICPLAQRIWHYFACKRLREFNILLIWLKMLLLFLKSTIKGLREKTKEEDIKEKSNFDNLALFTSLGYEGIGQPGRVASHLKGNLPF